LLSNKEDVLKKFTSVTKVPEMIISVLFLFTGIYLLTQLPSINSLLIIKIILVMASIPVAIIGFKKKNKVLAALSLLMITASYGLAEISAKRGSKKQNNSNEASVSMNAKQMYDMNCASCHGSDGKLGMAGAANLSVSNLDQQQIKEVILNGKGLMKSVDLSPEQADSVSAFVFSQIKGK
jgi:cytochrome c553